MVMNTNSRETDNNGNVYVNISCEGKHYIATPVVIDKFVTLTVVT